MSSAVSASGSGFNVQNDIGGATKYVLCCVAIGVICLIGSILCIVFACQYPFLAETLVYAACTGFIFSIVAFALAPRVRGIYEMTTQFSHELSSYNNSRSGTDTVQRGGDPVYTISSGERILISCVKSELRTNPRRHLQNFAQQIQAHVQHNNGANLHVSFTDQRGLDAGGLRKDFLDDLMSGVTDLENIFQKVEISRLAVPIARNTREAELYKQLGQMMMWCYPNYQIGFHLDPSVFRVALSLSAEEINGSYDALPFARKLELYNVLTYFQQETTHDDTLNLLAVDYWTEEQVARVVDKVNQGGTIPYDLIRVPHFEQIRNSQEDQQRVREALDDYLGDHAQDSEAQSLMSHATWNEEQVRQAVRITLRGDTLPDDLYEEHDPDPAAILSTEEGLMQLKGALEALAASFYDHQVRGIHAIAVGMKSVCVKGRASSVSEQNRHWNADFHVGVDDSMERCDRFSEQLQGRVDRPFVADHINYSGLQAPLRQKVQWLKEWIRDENTSEVKVRQLVKFITGSSSLPTNGSILVQQKLDSSNPTPVAHTCSSSVDLASQFCGELEFCDEHERRVNPTYRLNNGVITGLPPGVREVGVHDRTKEGFIRVIEAAISGETIGYSQI